MSVDPVRFGLIGFGAWGQCHADAITKTQGAELVAIAARSDKTCQSAREIYPQAKVFSNYRQMLERDDIDIVDIVLPTFLHHEAASTALSAGKHLLLEKPMAPTIQQCNELLQLAKEHDRLLAIGHELRLSSLWGKVKQLIDDGFVGDPQYVLVELSRNPFALVPMAGDSTSNASATGFSKNRSTFSILRAGIYKIMANPRRYMPRPMHGNQITPNCRITLVQL